MNTFIQNLRDQSLGNSDVQSEAKTTVANLIGIVASSFDSTLLEDLSDLISRGKREALDGYIFCLSRVVRHELAWQQIEKAFALQKEKVPAKYYSLFGQNPEQQKHIFDQNIKVL